MRPEAKNVVRNQQPPSQGGEARTPSRIRSVSQVGARWRVIVIYGKRSRRTLWFTTESAVAEAVAALKAAGAVYIEGTRGFGKMDPELHRRIAAAGGRAVHAQGHAHVFTSSEARAAGEKGGAVVLERYGKEHFAALGRVGNQKVRELQRKRACAKKS